MTTTTIKVLLALCALALAAMAVQAEQAQQLQSLGAARGVHVHTAGLSRKLAQLVFPLQMAGDVGTQPLRGRRHLLACALTRDGRRICDTKTRCQTRPDGSVSCVAG